MARTTLTTPRGVFIYPYLNEADTKYNAEGVYRVKLSLSPEDAADMVAAIDAAMENALATAIKEEESPAKRKKIEKKGLADCPYNETDEGKIEINFKMKASGIRKKDGKPWSMRPAIFDGQGNLIPSDQLPMIGGGTEGKISYEMGEFFTPLVGAGVSLRLRAVQVLSLVEFGGGTAEEHGFEAEEGAYTKNTVKTLEDLEEAPDEPTNDEDAEDISDF
jgi:hypothetical protein